MSIRRRYRDRNTGLIEVYPESMARTFDFLEEVDDDAKPLAYVPITAEAIEDFTSTRKAEGSKPTKDED